MTTLPALLGRRAPPADLRAFLDDAGPAGRTAALAALSRADQRALYELAGDDRPVTLDDFVPPGAAGPIPHRGYNTLPLPAFGRAFTKWMVRTPAGVGGYNASPLRLLVGPGYFTLRETEGDERRHGGVVVDYYRLPGGPFPADWPWVIPNWLGPQAFVYGWCHDYLRRVSDHVTIGAAFKWGVPVQSWFVLHRDG
jgi:hypothetical protein